MVRDIRPRSTEIRHHPLRPLLFTDLVNLRQPTTVDRSNWGHTFLVFIFNRSTVPCVGRLTQIPSR
jgi:hypothetical protein